MPLGGPPIIYADPLSNALGLGDQQRKLDEAAQNTPYTVQNQAKIEAEKRAAAITPKPVGQIPEIAPGTESTQDFQSRAMAEDEWRNYMLGGLNTPRIGPAVMPGYEDYTKIGGAEGHDMYRQAFDDIPAQIAGTAQDLGNEYEAFGKEKAQKLQGLQEQYGQDLTILKQRQAERQQQVMARQQQLDAATEKYSNDLADRGQFWRSPGGILAAISAAILTMSSDDHAIGIKMMNQAVQQDFMQRKQLADMHLGELRSNLANYRQIAGDAELGDRLGLAESHRIAAMELDRLSAQMQGKEAKLKMSAMANDQLQRSLMLKMQVHSMAVAHDPRLENPLLAKEYQAMGKAIPGVGPTPYKGDWTPEGKKQSGTKTGGGPAGPAPSPTGGGSGTSVPSAAGSVDGAAQNLFKQSGTANIQRRAPGMEKMVDMFKSQYIKEAAIEAHGDPSKIQGLVLKKMDAEAAQADTIFEKNKGLTTKSKGYQQMIEMMDRLEAEKPKGMSNDQYLGSLRDFTGYAERINDLRQKYGDNPKSPEAAAEMANLKRAERFHQMVADKQLTFYHNMLGGAMSQDELMLARPIIVEGASWNKIRGFLADQSTQTAGQLQEAYNQGGPRVAALVQIRHGQAIPGLNTRGQQAGVPQK